MPEIRLQRANPPRFEVLDLLERLQQRFLDKVVCIRQVARPFGKPSAGPALERLQVPREQPFDRSLVSGPGSTDQLERRVQIVDSIARPGAEFVRIFGHKHAGLWVSA